jgi:phage gp46-like protein
MAAWVIVLGASGSLNWFAVSMGSGLPPGANPKGVDLRLSSPGGADIDLELANGDLVMDQGLATSVLASLWTDGRASSEDGLAVEDDPRGYWADRPGDRWGSLLWLTERSKMLEETLREAEAYASESLEWMRARGIASNIKAAASWVEQGHLRIELTITPDTRPRWSEYWLGTELESGSGAARDSTRLLFG